MKASFVEPMLAAMALLAEANGVPNASRTGPPSCWPRNIPRQRVNKRAVLDAQASPASERA